VPLAIASALAGLLALRLLARTRPASTSAVAVDTPEGTRSRLEQEP
jgi:hypothetical protein